jgi:hypothetical protein
MAKGGLCGLSNENLSAAKMGEKQPIHRPNEDVPEDFDPQTEKVRQTD